MKLKSLEEFLNESYIGSMSSIITKMKNEMKSAQVIYQYLFTLGVDPIRIQEEMRKHGPYAIEFSSEYKINSDKHRNPAGFPGPSGRMSGVNESDITKETLEEKFKIEKDPSGNYKWTFKITSYDDSKTYNMLTSKGYKELNNAGVEFGTSPEGMWVMGDTEDEKKKAIKVLKSIGITESFMNEEGDLEDQLDDLEADLEKTSDEVKDKETSEEPSSQPETEKKEDALKSAISDIEKLDKIRKILAESFDIEGVEDDVIENVIDYHVEEKMSTEEKSKLKDTDFIFPEEKSWPIHDEKHAKTALIWATWPQNKDIKSKIVKEVLKRYPNLKGYGAAK